MVGIKELLSNVGLKGIAFYFAENALEGMKLSLGTVPLAKFA
ncbi:MAG: hypothetical protein AAFQ89_03220 [Cyanobacteria bacterium J06626_18]